MNHDETDPFVRFRPRAEYEVAMDVFQLVSKRIEAGEPTDPQELAKVLDEATPDWWKDTYEALNIAEALGVTSYKLAAGERKNSERLAEAHETMMALIHLYDHYRLRAFVQKAAS